jgi:hypothetical protein
MRKGLGQFLLKLVGALMLIASALTLSFVFGIVSILLLLVGTVLLTTT